MSSDMTLLLDNIRVKKFFFFTITNSIELNLFRVILNLLQNVGVLKDDQSI
jgi:hypothetical protein